MSSFDYNRYEETYTYVIPNAKMIPCLEAFSHFSTIVFLASKALRLHPHFLRFDLISTSTIFALSCVFLVWRGDLEQAERPNLAVQNKSVKVDE